MTPLVAAVLLAAASTAAAQPQDSVKWRQEGQKTIIEAANGLSWEEGDVVITFLTGGMSVKRPDSTLQAARALLWKKRNSPEIYDEIYAEGNVIFTRGTQKLNCERFFYSNVKESGAIVDLRLKAYSKDLLSNFFAMAKEARVFAKEGKMVADDARPPARAAPGCPSCRTTGPSTSTSSSRSSAASPSSTCRASRSAPG